jgi:hypothetical protein
LLRYTGEETDVAVCYQFQTDDPAGLALLIPEDISRSNAIETSPTPHGTFFAVTEELINSAWMVKVMSGNFEESIEEVDTLSVLLLMAPTRIELPTTAMIGKVFDTVKNRWRLRSAEPVEAVRLLIAEIQWGLAIIGRFDGTGRMTGVMDRRTLVALKELFYKDGGRFTFTVEMTDYIHKQVVMSERTRK